ncbi:hypothetical protein CRUP_026403 [Coryphaenoides rupestris]|nr:hypothetical protein CRUP_026403 [Coryphaenoides rupestris]
MQEKKQEKEKWCDGQPRTSADALLAFGEHLTEFERKEIQGYSEKHKDHIAYRYEVLQLMGKGACGQVLKFTPEGKGEVKMLKLLQTDDNKITNVIQMKENFYFWDHMCITFDLMTMDLFDMMCARNRTGLPTPQIKHHTVSLLQALRFLSQKNIIHCDLKPENILVSRDDPVVLKLADFGSSHLEHLNSQRQNRGKTFKILSDVLNTKDQLFVNFIQRCLE